MYIYGAVAHRRRYCTPQGPGCALICVYFITHVYMWLSLSCLFLLLFLTRSADSSSTHSVYRSSSLQRPLSHSHIFVYIFIIIICVRVAWRATTRSLFRASNTHSLFFFLRFKYWSKNFIYARAHIPPPLLLRPLNRFSLSLSLPRQHHPTIHRSFAVAPLQFVSFPRLVRVALYQWLKYLNYYFSSFFSV